MNKNTQGFTIVELLIVIVVIAILAAISIVTYSGITHRAHDTSVKSDLAHIGRKIGLYVAEFDTVPTTLATLQSLGLEVSKESYAPGWINANDEQHNLLYCRNSNTNRFVLLAWSKSGARGFMYKDGAVVDTSRTPSGSGNACHATDIASNGNIWLYQANVWRI